MLFALPVNDAARVSYNLMLELNRRGNAYGTVVETIGCFLLVISLIVFKE